MCEVFVPLTHASTEVQEVLSFKFREEPWADNVSLGVICIIEKVFKVIRKMGKGEGVGERMREEIKTDSLIQYQTGTPIFRDPWRMKG